MPSRAFRAALGASGPEVRTSRRRAARRGDLFAPVGALVPAALRASQGRTVVCGGIHMSDLPCFPFAPVGERVVRSVANLTAGDARISCARASMPVRTAVVPDPLAPPTRRSRISGGRVQGAAVLVTSA